MSFGRNSMIFCRLMSTNQLLRAIPTLECIGSKYITLMFPVNDTCVLQNVRRDKVAFSRAEAQRFTNWEHSVKNNHERLVRWATSIGARESRKQKNKAADIAANTADVAAA